MQNKWKLLWFNSIFANAVANWFNYKRIMTTLKPLFCYERKNEPNTHTHTWSHCVCLNANIVLFVECLCVSKWRVRYNDLIATNADHKNTMIFFQHFFFSFSKLPASLLFMLSVAHYCCCCCVAVLCMPCSMHHNLFWFFSFSKQRGIN